MTSRILVLLVAVLAASAEAQSTKSKTSGAKKTSPATATTTTGTKKTPAADAEKAADEADKPTDKTTEAKKPATGTKAETTQTKASSTTKKSGTAKAGAISASKAAASGAKPSGTGKTKATSAEAKKSAEATADTKTKGSATAKKSATGSTKDSSSSAKSAGTAAKTPSGSTKRSSSTTAKAAASLPTVERPPQDNAGEEPVKPQRIIGPNVTLDPADLADFDRNSPDVQRLMKLGLDLVRRDLTYRYGSSDPSTGGMDCSGTIYYLLKAAGIKNPPRDSSGLYLWAEKEGTLRRVQPTSLEDPAFADLRPGDLLFWEGTYEVQRDPPISHTMIYLGREKKSGKHVMVGASDGRTYGGISRNGVSVFDFRLPRPESTAKFVGYARVPGLQVKR